MAKSERRTANGRAIDESESEHISDDIQLGRSINESLLIDALAASAFDLSKSNLLHLVHLVHLVQSTAVWTPESAVAQ